MHDCTYERIEKLRAVLFVLFFPFFPFLFFCKQTIQHEILIKIHFLYVFFFSVSINFNTRYIYIHMVSNPEFELTAEISNIFQTYVRIRLRAQLEHVQNIFSNKNKTFTSRLRKIVGRKNSNRSRILSIYANFSKKI